MKEQLALLPGYLTAHLQLTLFALLIGTLVSIPAGILLTRRRWLEQPVLGVASVIQTIPSLALLALMVPALAALGFRSIGFLPAFIGLVLYSVLPILRNTVAGLNGVDESLLEAARGVGMTAAQSLTRVELPLAMPVILAGVRTSTVWTVGVATLSTPVGATSLGNYIFSGLQTRNLSAVLVGCIAAAALALLLDALVWALGAAVQRRKRLWIRTVLAIIGALYVFTAATLVSALQPASARQVVIGAKTFTEQYILSEILSGQIHDATGAPTRIVSSLGSTVAFDALVSGDIDVYVDYSGTIWTTLMHRDGVNVARQDVLDGVRQFLHDEHGVELVGTLGFENTYALAMPAQKARELGATRIGDLAAAAPGLSIGGDYEFFGRPEWKAVQETYGLQFREQRSMDSSLMYQAAGSGQVDVISAFSTDGRIAVFDLAVLEDDRGAIPPYDAIILAGPRLLAEHPKVIDALRKLTGTIDAEHMRRMNRAVDEDGAAPAAVAREFLGQLL
jgi:osmoprotectant transport system permease protein